MNKEDVVHMYNGKNSHKKNDIMPFAAAWMELETFILSEVSQKEKDKYHLISLLIWNLKITQMNLSMKQKQTHGQVEPTWC